MIGPLISLGLRLAGRIGVPEPLRRLAAIAALIATVVFLLLAARLGWSFWLAAHDRRIVAADREEASAEASGRVLAAERAAGAAKDGRDKAFATEQAQLKDDADAAARNRTSPLDAVFDGLR